jgi:hypothetical protein
MFVVWWSGWQLFSVKGSSGEVTTRGLRQNEKKAESNNDSALGAKQF